MVVSKSTIAIALKCPLIFSAFAAIFAPTVGYWLNPGAIICPTVSPNRGYISSIRSSPVAAPVDVSVYPATFVIVVSLLAPALYALMNTTGATLYCPYKTSIASHNVNVAVSVEYPNFVAASFGV